MKKFIGIARKVDNLGRVVIPKSYREELKLKEGDKVRTLKKGKGYLGNYRASMQKFGERYSEKRNSVLLIFFYLL